MYGLGQESDTLPPQTSQIHTTLACTAASQEQMKVEFIKTTSVFNDVVLVTQPCWVACVHTVSQQIRING